MARLGVGMDVGATSVRVAQVERRGGTLRLTGALRLARPEAAPEAPEGDLEAETALALGEAVAAAGIPSAGALLSISGKDVILRYTQVPPVPDWRLKMLMDFEIGELSGRAGGEVASDYRVLEVPPDAAGNRTVLVGLAKVELLASRLASLSAARVAAADACPSSLGLFHAFLAVGPPPAGETTMLLDIGARNTEIAIQKDGALLFARNLSAGGNLFTQAVADALRLKFAEAEQVKVREGNVAPMRAMRAANPRAEAILSGIAAAAAQYTSMIQSSLMFARAQTRLADLAPTRVLLSGGGSRLRGLDEFLAGSLKTKVEPFEPIPAVQPDLGDPEAEARIQGLSREMAVAVGLARAALGEPGVRLTLVPPRVARRREFVRRKLFLWLSGAAGVLVFATGFAGAMGERGAISSVHRDSKTRVAEARALRGEIEDIAARMAEVREARRRLEAEVAPGLAFVKLLAGLQAAAPPSLFLENVHLRPLDEATIGSGAVVRVEGKIGESDEDAAQLLVRFQEKVAALPVVARCERKKEEARGGVRAFELEITLAGPGPAASGGNP